MSVDISQLITEFGDFYKDGGQSLKDLRGEIMVMNETDELFQLQPTNDTVLDGGQVVISDVLQAYQDTYTKAGDTAFTGKRIPLHQLKIDFQENPSKIEKSWLGFLASNSANRADWPLIRYIIDQLIIKKATENWETSGIYGGVAGAITPGTPLMVSGAINGIKKVINLGIANEDDPITPITLGAVPTDPVDFVDYVETFARAIPEHVMPHLQQLAMSKTLWRRFRQGMRKKYNEHYQQADITTVMDYDNLVVKGYASHAGSTKIWTTIKGNAVMGFKKPELEKVFSVKEYLRDVAIYTDFYKGIGFWQNQYIYTNDVETS